MSAQEKDEKEKLSVSITAPAGSLFQGTADFLQIPGREGVLGITPHHTRLVSLLRQGDIIIKNEGQTPQTFLITEGILQINREEIEIVVNTP
ncbi:MAG: hypothetical protein KKH94_05675 [Candidatus Omnitrophica bacterium]|nr:hypothetical protein [Candidatus Omnitrophota bacterium]